MAIMLNNNAETGFPAPRNMTLVCLWVKSHISRSQSFVSLSPQFITSLKA